MGRRRKKVRTLKLEDALFTEVRGKEQVGVFGSMLVIGFSIPAIVILQEPFSADSFIKLSFLAGSFLLLFMLLIKDSKSEPKPQNIFQLSLVLTIVILLSYLPIALLFSVAYEVSNGNFYALLWHGRSAARGQGSAVLAGMYGVFCCSFAAHAIVRKMILTTRSRPTR